MVEIGGRFEELLRMNQSAGTLPNMRSGKPAGCAMNGQCHSRMAPSLSIAAHVSSVGTMSRIAALMTLSG